LAPIQIYRRAFRTAKMLYWFSNAYAKVRRSDDLFKFNDLKVFSGVFPHFRVKKLQSKRKIYAMRHLKSRLPPIQAWVSREATAGRNLATELHFI
jgi:hypothetical protein